MRNTEIVRREGPERRRETLERLDRERDIWLSTAHPEHGPHQLPLWFRWDGRALWMCTGESSVTVRNARKEPRVRLSLPDTSDVVLVQGEAECFPAREVPQDAGDGFAAKFGWDPREADGSYVYLRVTPRTVRAWRGEHELNGRVLMRDGAWLA
ncbi:MULTISPECIES: pyridoxamine 5'-phosphate oxidase family protein [unclassified Streptomyces]|uniref:pyridoxamine 5'-phosphate oxidase family protein n=1 Tax=unclassified Streptomyces TaxID=2593676 RepID=UPI003660579D